MKIKTGVAAAIVLVAGGYVGATAFTSWKIAQVNETQQRKLEKDLPFVTVAGSQVEGNIFASTYSTTYRFGCKVMANEMADPSQSGCKPVEFVVKNHVRTGPFPGMRFAAAVVETEISGMKGLPEGAQNYLAGMKRQDIQTVVGYDGAYRFAARFPAGSNASSARKEAWSEFQVNATGSVDDGAFDASVPEFTLTGDDQEKRATIKLVNLRLQGASQPGSHFLLRPGTTSWSIERAQFDDADVSLQLTKLSERTELNVDKDGFLGITDQFTGNLSVQLGKDAKPFEFTDFEYRQSVKHLEQDSLSKLLALWTDKMSLIMSGRRIESEELVKDSFDEAMPLIKKLLVNDPQIAIDKLAVTFRGQRGEMSASAGVPGLEAVELDKVLPAALHARFKGKIDAKVPVGWLQALGELKGGDVDEAEAKQGAEMLAQMAVQSGYATRDGDFLVSSGTRENGVSKINGKPIDLFPGLEPDADDTEAAPHPESTHP